MDKTTLVSYMVAASTINAEVCGKLVDNIDNATDKESKMDASRHAKFHMPSGSGTNRDSVVSYIDEYVSGTIDITSVSLNKSSLALNQGASEKLIASVLPKKAAATTTLSWASANSSYVAVDNSGNVNGVLATTDPVRVTVTATKGATVKTAYCDVTVNAPSNVVAD